MLTEKLLSKTKRLKMQFNDLDDGVLRNLTKIVMCTEYF